MGIQRTLAKIVASKHLEHGHRSTASVKVLRDRLTLERKLKAVLCPWIMFALILTCFFMNLLSERPIAQMYKLKSNLKKHFALPKVYDIYQYEKMYTYLYNFMETAERFDPLDRARYVGRTYGPPDSPTLDFVPETTDQVTLTRTKKFYGVSAVLIRPMVMMTRGTRASCAGYAIRFDKYYALARYLRYKYKGQQIPGAWQPRRVWFKSAVDDTDPSLLAIRENTSKPYLAQVTSKLAGSKGSSLLMCILPEMNNTMRRSLVTNYQNVPIAREAGTYFGDLVTAKSDILAYMGYVVNPSEVNFTEFPRCYLSDKRNSQGEVIKGEEKVSPSDVADRCKRTSKRWHDVQTKLIVAQVFLYTPVIEVFTRVQVSFRIGQTGNFHNDYEVTSWQALVHTDRYTLWLVLTVVQVILSAMEVVIVIAFICKAKRDDRNYPKAALFDKQAEIRDYFQLLLQLMYLGFYVYRIIAEHAASDFWDVIDDYLATNPYDGEDGMSHATERLNTIISFSKRYQNVRIYAFVLVLLSFGQNVMYMNVHPQIGLLANMLIAICSALLHFLMVFGILYTILCLVGAWAFGADMATFSTVAESFAKGFRWAVFGGSLMDNEGELNSMVDKALLTTWEVTFTFVVTVFLMNAFLAIVVAGYNCAYHMVLDNEAVRNIVLDFALLVYAEVTGVAFSWPHRPAVVTLLVDMAADGKKEITAEDLCKHDIFSSIDEAEIYLSFYIQVAPKINAGHVSRKLTEKALQERKDAKLGAIREAKQMLAAAKENAASAGLPASGLTESIANGHENINNIDRPSYESYKKEKSKVAVDNFHQYLGDIAKTKAYFEAISAPLPPLCSSVMPPSSAPPQWEVNTPPLSNGAVQSHSHMPKWEI